MKVTFVGDIHGYYNILTILNNYIKTDKIIQCGDFGIWPGLYHKVKVKPLDIPIYFCRGNHENHDVLDTFPEFQISNLKTSQRIARDYLSNERNINQTNIKKLLNIQFKNADNIFFCDTGSILNINNTKILFIGGAYSIDKHLRLIGKSWWPQEILRNNEIDYLLNKINDNIDIIVSHTCPKFIFPFLNLDLYHYPSDKYKDPVSLFLNDIYDKFKPKQWFCGHMHLNKVIKYNDTVFHILNTCDINKYYPGLYHTIEI